MSTSPVQAGNPFDQLARTLFQTFDANRDGTLGTDEFSAIVARLTALVSASTPQRATGTTSACPACTAPLLPATAAVAGRVRSPLEGFDAGKLANLEHRTPKYLFARVAQQADLSSVTSKASGELVLRGMVPDLEAAGLRVLDVKGDKIRINDGSRDVWVDVIRGASSGSPAFQWLPVEA